jgi:Leucine-rich repeat (LRR) protein
MSALRHLYLRGTNFSYTIPNWLYNMTTLERLDLSNNHIQGVLPSAFGRLSQLMYLDLSNNSLEGKLPRFLGNLCNLQHLDLSYNKLNGGAVYELLGNSSACSAPSLEFLNLATNKLSGVVPPWFWNHSSQMSFLDLSDNNFHGSITSLSCGVEVYLGSNNFSGPLPNISSTIQYLDLSNNLFSGFSTAFCEDLVMHRLSFLDLSRNLLSGEIPDCWVFNYVLLEELYLGNNNLTGNIPSSIGSIPSLLSLSLHKNNLEGNLPLSMENQTAIELLDLSENHFSGILPLWFGKSLFTLMVLVLRSNNFSGSLPQELCRQTQLQILDVSSNNFSGSIPRCFGNFTAMVRPAYGDRIFDFIPPKGGFSQSTFLVRNGMEYEYRNILALVTSMDLSSNNLIGEIPEELTNLYGLLLLNLSNNQLHGKIPEKIDAMKLLESLDVSMNQLIGVIPQGMASLTFLSHLNLSYNNFTGRIPSGTQLQSFTGLSFIGNHDLCGPPLTPSCIGDDTPPEPTTPNFDDKGREHDGGWIDMKWFYISMPLGFVVGFWGVFAPLALNKAWRSVYLSFLMT